MVEIEVTHRKLSDIVAVPDILRGVLNSILQPVGEESGLHESLHGDLVGNHGVKDVNDRLQEVLWPR